MDRPGANAGVALAGVALVGAVLPWPDGVATVAGVALGGAATAGTAFAAFLACKHGLLDRRVGAVAAGLASLAALAYAGYGLAVGLTAESTPFAGVAVAGVGAPGGVLAAYVDWRAIPPDRLEQQATDATVAVAVGLGGYLAIVAWTYVLAVPVLAVFGDLSPAASNVVGTFALGLGTASTAAAYLQATDRDRSFVDLARPTRREVAYAVGGVVALFGALRAVQAVYGALGVTSSTHGLVEVARNAPWVLLVLVPASLLVVGPGEELLFRNVVQKSLYDAFSRAAAVGIASVAFAAVHFSAFWGGSLGSTLASLTTVFVLSLVLGAVYARTDNLLVPAFVHGSFNAVQFAALYYAVAL